MLIRINYLLKAHIDKDKFEKKINLKKTINNYSNSILFKHNFYNIFHNLH